MISKFGKVIIVLLILALLGAFFNGCGRLNDIREEPDEEKETRKVRNKDNAEKQSQEGNENGTEEAPDPDNAALPENYAGEGNANHQAPESPGIDEDIGIEPQTGPGKAAGSDILKDDFILPESNTRRYEYWDLFELFNDQMEAAYARNEIFARHGHTFDKEIYQTYFAGKPWYTPKGKVSMESLNEFEQYNAKLLLFFEKGYQGPYPPAIDVSDSGTKSWLIKKLPPDTEFSVDLDGDGVKEKVSWKKNLDSEAVIKINNISIKVPADNSGSWADNIAIVDLDSKDKYKEIIICDHGPSADEWSYYYEYRSGKINLIGETAGIVEFSIHPDGKGKVVASTRARLLHTWFFYKGYTLDSNHRLSADNVDYYNTAYPVFLKSPIQLAESRNSRGKWFTVKDGQAALLSATDNESWCRLTLEDGTQGWFLVQNFSTIVKDNKEAGMIFENLCYAD